MTRRILSTAAAPVVAVLGILVALLAVGPVADRLARRLLAAPRRLPGEAALGPRMDALGGEAVALRSRDGIRLAGRWLPASPVSGDDPEAWRPDPREAILLLHGYSGSIAPDLVEVGPFLRGIAGVLGLDFRGHGGSDDGPTTFGLLEVEDVAGALAWLGERGIRRVALCGSSMGGVTALAALAVLGDGRLAAADKDLDAAAVTTDAPRPRIVAVIADSVAPELSVAVGTQMAVPGGRRIASRMFSRFPGLVGGDPRATQPIAVIGLAEDVPVLLLHGGRDTVVPMRDARRLVAAAPDTVRHVVIDAAGHGDGHAVDPRAWEAAAGDLLRAAFGAARA